MHANTSGLLSQEESGERSKGTFSRENTGWSKKFCWESAVPTGNTASPLAFPTDARFNPATLLQERPDS